ncbi:MAG: hypothetical protein ACLPUO_01680 [Streptosporangiaceae bacterium]|jgi:hypothetical protein
MASGIRGGGHKHGTASAYNNYGCRCELCRTAASAARRAWAESLQDRPFAEVPHGTASGYRNWGCRCERCSLVRAAEVREEQQRKRAGGAAPSPA